MNAPSLAAKAAWFAAVAFVVGLVVAALTEPEFLEADPNPGRVWAQGAPFLVFHLALFPVVAALAAPGWAKGAGYAWLIVDNALIVMSAFGEGGSLVVPLRWGLHLATATWILGASWPRDAALAFRSTGAATVLLLLASTVAGPFVADDMVQRTLGPAALTLVAWLVLAAGRIRSQRPLAGTAA